MEQDVADVVARHGLRGLTGYEVPLGPFAVVPFLPYHVVAINAPSASVAGRVDRRRNLISRIPQRSNRRRATCYTCSRSNDVSVLQAQKISPRPECQPPPISDLTPADILLSTVTDLVGLESTAHLPSLDSRAVTFFLDKMGWSTAIDGQEGEKLAELIDMPFEGDQLWPLVGAMREYFHHFSEITLGKLTLLDKRQGGGEGRVSPTYHSPFFLHILSFFNTVY